MAGSLEKRGENSWRMVYFKGRDEEGKRTRYTRSFKGTKAQAEKALAKFVTEVESGQVAEGENMLFGDLCERWLVEYGKEHLSPKAYQDYQKIIEKRLRPAFGRQKIHDIRPLMITKLYRELRDPAKRLDGAKAEGQLKALSGATIQKYHRVLSSIFSTAVKWQLIAANPCERVEVPQKEYRETSFYDETLLAKLFGELAGEHIKYQTLVILAVLTALRRGELVGLKWEDIDFDNSTLVVSKQAQYISTAPPAIKTDAKGTWVQAGFKPGITYRVKPKLAGYTFSPAYLEFDGASAALNFTATLSGDTQAQKAAPANIQAVALDPDAYSTSGRVVDASGKAVAGVALKFSCTSKGAGILIREPKTKSSRRTIALSASAVALLKEYKKAQNEERLKVGDLWQQNNYVFTAWDGTIMHPDTPSSWFSDFLKAHNLPHIRFHDLRHSSATVLLGNGVPLKNVSARLGHSSASITANVYAHALVSVDRQAAEKLDQIMKRGQV